MSSEFQKIKLEEEVQSPSSLAATSRLPEWVTPESQTDQAIYREALVSFEQLIESYRYRSADHPVAIKIEEQDTSKDKTDLELAEEILQDPEFAQEAERESFADRQVREHQESQRAVRAGTRKATLESHKLLKRAKVTGRYKTTSDTEESESESLANIATC